MVKTDLRLQNIWPLVAMMTVTIENIEGKVIADCGGAVPCS